MLVRSQRTETAVEGLTRAIEADSRMLVTTPLLVEFFLVLRKLSTRRQVPDAEIAENLENSWALEPTLVDVSELDV